MIKLNLTIDDEAKVFDIPQSWEDVTVGMYERIASLDKTKDEFELTIDALCVLSGMSLDDAYALPIARMPEILEQIGFTNKEIEPTDKEFIVIDGVEYYLKKDFSQLTNGEVISLDLIKKKYSNNIEKAIPEMLCIFLRKKKENGNLEGFKNSLMDRADLFRDKAPIADVYNMFLFFLNGKKK
jgi:hypothetical protein